MKRNCNSSRSQKWISRNSLNNPLCVSYVNKLCSIQFEFTNFDFKPYDKESDALWITYGIHSYIIEIDEDLVGLKVFEKNCNSSTKDRYHLLDKNFFGDSCWYDCFYWIKNRI